MCLLKIFINFENIAGKPEDDTVSVLFEVVAKIKDFTIEQRKSFARIIDYSSLGEAETEVLFSIDEQEKQEVIEDYQTLRTYSSETKIIRIGRLLANHPKQGVAQFKAFYEFMRLSDTCVPTCTAGFGWLALKEHNGKSAIELQQQALNLYEQLPKNEKDNYTYLYTTSYKCIGAGFRLMKIYRHALDYYNKAEELQLKIPIDKYAMYQGYQNITSIHIASIHQLLGEIDLAWKNYKKILAYGMNTPTHFHGHTYLTLTQAGLYEAKLDQHQAEYDRCSQPWKALLDKSLTNMTSNYRHTIISGVFLIGFECTDNEQQRQMPMDYCQKVINISCRYINVNRDDYLIVLKCINQLAR